MLTNLIFACILILINSYGTSVLHYCYYTNKFNVGETILL